MTKKPFTSNNAILSLPGKYPGFRRPCPQFVTQAQENFDDIIRQRHHTELKALDRMQNATSGVKAVYKRHTTSCTGTRGHYLISSTFPLLIY